MSDRSKGIISSVLSPACRLWLRSQVSQVAELHVNITGGDRVILGGTIPQVNVIASGAVYQGLYLGYLDLLATNIRINLPQVMRGKPLKLLEPIRVEISAILNEADLQASLASPLLSQGINDLLERILNTPSTATEKIEWEHLEIVGDSLHLQGKIASKDTHIPIDIHTAIDIIDGHKLTLDPLEMIGFPQIDINSYAIDLGTDVNITSLSLHDRKLILAGQIQVQP